ncbi:MAG: class I SAM-dependent methyltransferase [Anaerolineales bacterium]|nr:class I SAM-dependent methyltransferase [Anaerolineales bacterium]
MFPLLYHAHHNRHLEDLPFWLNLARQQGSPVLELGCGTGRVLIPLAQSGIEVVGLDNDFAMLDHLQRNLPSALQPAPRLLTADITDFSLGQTFPLVILPCNTWSTLEASQRQLALACIYRHLPLAGRFSFSVPNPHLLRDLPARSDLEFEEAFDLSPTSILQVSSGWRRSKTGFTVTWQYETLYQDGNLERLTVRERHTLATTQDYVDEIQAVGLHIESLYGDFDRSLYDPDAPELILVAVKPA